MLRGKRVGLERGGRHPGGCGEEGEHEGAEDGSADDLFKLLLHDGTCLGKSGLGCGICQRMLNK